MRPRPLDPGAGREAPAGGTFGPRRWLRADRPVFRCRTARAEQGAPALSPRSEYHHDGVIGGRRGWRAATSFRAGGGAAVEWDLGPVGLGVLLAMSLGFGVIAQLVVRRTSRWLWLVAAGTYFVSGLVISEVWFG